MNRLIIRNRPFGFFSNLLHIIDNLYWCEQNKFIPQIEWRDALYCINQGVDNVWDYYFNKIYFNINNVGNLILESNTFRTNDFIFDNVNNLDRANLWNQNSEDRILTRQKVNLIINKYIKLNQNIKCKIDNFIVKNNTIGVHIRGTDYFYLKNIELKKYINTIKQIDNYSKYNIFVCSDNFESIDVLKNTFENVSFYPSIHRQNKYTNEYPICIDKSLKAVDKKVHGEEVLIESILLSKCDKIVCTTSNVSLFALLYNPDSDFILVE